MSFPEGKEHLDIEGSNGGVLKRSGFPRLDADSHWKIDGDNESVDDLLESAAGWTHIRSIRVGCCKRFTGEGFRHLTRLTGLTHIVVIGCPNFTAEGLRYLHGVADLTFIKFSFGSFSVTDAGVRAACQFPNVESLQLVHCHALTGDRTFEDIHRLKTLYSLSIVGCHGLRRLELDGLSENILLSQWVDCPVLEEIHLSHSPAVQKYYTEHPFSRGSSFPLLRRVTFDGVEQPILD